MAASAGGIDITAAKAIDITTSANDANITIDPNGTGTLALGTSDNTAATIDAKSFSLDAAGDASNITVTTDADEEDGEPCRIRWLLSALQAPRRAGARGHAPRGAAEPHLGPDDLVDRFLYLTSRQPTTALEFSAQVWH